MREAAVAHEDAAASIQLGDINCRVTFLLSLVHDPAKDVALLRLGEEVNTLGEEDVQQLLRDGQPDLDAEVGPGGSKDHPPSSCPGTTKGSRRRRG